MPSARAISCFLSLPFLSLKRLIYPLLVYIPSLETDMSTHTCLLSLPLCSQKREQAPPARLICMRPCLPGTEPGESGDRSVATPPLKAASALGSLTEELTTSQC